MSDNHDLPKRPDSETAPKGGWYLFELLQSGNNERTIQAANQVLSQNPLDEDAHYCLAIAFSEDEQPKQAKPHVDFLLEHHPEAENTHIAACVLAYHREKWRQLGKHAEEGRRLRPDDSRFHYYLALSAGFQLKTKKAIEHIERSLALDPSNSTAIAFRVRLRSLSFKNENAKATWKNVRELESALALDAEDPSLHSALGDFYLGNLDNPKQAEHHYRHALLADPTNTSFQRDLFESVAKRSLLYRVLHLPTRNFQFWRRVPTLLRYKPGYVLFFVFGLKFLSVYFGWLILATFAFWPASKIYEFLLVSEIKAGSKASFNTIRTWHRLQQWPFWIRFSAFLLFLGCLYVGLFLYLNLPIVESLVFLLGFAAVHYLLIAISRGSKFLRAQMAKKRINRHELIDNQS